MNRLMIIGASGHGKVVADIAMRCGYTDIAFLDDHSETKMCLNYPVVGTSSDAMKYKICDFVIAIGNAAIRKKIQSQLMQDGLHIVSLIHPNAVIGSDIKIGAGTVIMAGTVINPGTVIGEGCIINTCASVDHDCVVEDYAHVSVGAHLAGTVHVGEKTWIGAGATVSNNINICADCMIGAGAVVVKNIIEKGTYVGIPVSKI